MDLSAWPLPWVVVAFLLCAVVIGVAGTRMTRLADQLADITGLGEALFGAVLLGGSTSLPGIIASVTAAAQGYPELAVSNAVGGIAAQTAFLAVADMSYRHANLEHAAASLENMVQAALLLSLLALPILAMGTPDVTLLGVHPASVVLVVSYLFGLNLVRKAGSEHLWLPELTPETEEDVPEDDLGDIDVLRTWLAFGALALIVATAGYGVAETGIALAEQTGFSETVVGTFFTAVATSLPELVTSVAAVRRGALTLAVGGIIGGNSFDVLFIAFSDVAYQQGSIYAAITERQVFVIALTLFLTGVMLLGLLRREKHGLGGIGFESVVVLLAYVGAVALQFWQG